MGSYKRNQLHHLKTDRQAKESFMRKLVPYTSWLSILASSSTYKSVILLTRKNI